MSLYGLEHPVDDFTTNVQAAAAVARHDLLPAVDEREPDHEPPTPSQRGPVESDDPWTKREGDGWLTTW